MSEGTPTIDATRYGPGYQDPWGRGPLGAYFQDAGGMTPNARAHEPKPWKPSVPLSSYGEPESPRVPEAKRPDVAFWRAVLAEVISEAVEKAREAFHADLNLKLESVRKAYGRLREELRTESDDGRHAREVIDLVLRRVEEVEALIGSLSPEEVGV